jgi:[CysO sulfur-carrier protein]-S-L-cysteine hydrolase
MKLLQVDDAVLAETIAHLRGCLPDEGVGLWSGQGRCVTAWRPLQNVAARPATRYAVSPQEWLNAWQSCAERGETALALVHSHPTAAAVPSQRDLDEWHYPDLFCAIFSFREEEADWNVYQLNSSS